MKKLLFIGVLLFSVHLHAKDFYYYKGEKIQLTANNENLFITCHRLSEEELNKRVESIGTVTYFRKNKYHQRLNKTFRNAPEWMVDDDNYYATIHLKNPVLQKEDFTALERLLKKDSLIYHVTQHYTYNTKDPFAITNSIWVQVDQENDIPRLREEAGKINYVVLGQNPFTANWVMLAAEPTATRNALEASQYIVEHKLGVIAEPDMRGVMKTTCVNDTYFTSQWGLNNTGQYSGLAGVDSRVCNAWNITTGSPDVDIAVIDHGFENNHPDLSGNLQNNGYDAENGTTPTAVWGNHGTPCAGIIAASGNNSAGVAGVARGCQLMSISEFVLTSSAAEAADGFFWASNNGAEVISNSWFVTPPSGLLDVSIATALVTGRSGLGCVVVFAAGNDNGVINYPANSNPNIITVGAMSPCGERKNPSSCDGEGWGSNFGNELDVVAPGVLISSTDRQGNNGYNINTSMNNFTNRDYTAWFNGTSSACPHVAGVAALVLSVNPCLSQAQVQSIIRRSAQRIGVYNYNTNTNDGTWNNEMGCGLVNAEAAVIMAQTKYLQNTTVSGNMLYRSPRIFAGYQVNPSIPWGNFHTTSTSNVTIQGSLYIDFREGCDLQGTVHAQITGVGSCNGW
jgi:subtilisin family serine protease